MQTFFSDEQLKDPVTKRSNEILRACVHCGFCTATCPTYQILGDELDSPRGRIYLIKDMLENQRTPDAKMVKHVDRCLSCLSCMTTCPSGVHYMHLVDHARSYIETHYNRPFTDRAMRWALAKILPYPYRFRIAMLGAKIVKPFARFIPDKRVQAMMAMVPRTLPPVSRRDDPQVFTAKGAQKKRVALMTGCAQKALNTDINDATIRLLTRLGVDVVIAKGQGCCGALTHHMGKTEQSHAFAEKNIEAWSREIAGDGLDAIIINTSGCGTTIKDYGHMFRTHESADQAQEVANRALDVSEFLSQLDLPELPSNGIKVAYHTACSLQHGQQVKEAPKALLRRVGFDVVEPRDAHLCCGSAGTYNLLQPEIAGELKAKKLRSLEAIEPDVIAAGNIGCMMQIGSGSDLPIVHTVELLDWALGGERPKGVPQLSLLSGK